MSGGRIGAAAVSFLLLAAHWSRLTSAGSVRVLPARRLHGSGAHIISSGLPEGEAGPGLLDICFCNVIFLH